MSRKQVRDDRQFAGRELAHFISFQSSEVVGYIAPGSNVYVPADTAARLPRGRFFVAAFVGKEVEPRYFNAIPIGSTNNKRVVLQLGKEQSSQMYRPGLNS